MNWFLSFLLVGALAAPGLAQEHKKDHRIEALEKLYPVLKDYYDSMGELPSDLFDLYRDIDLGLQIADPTGC